MIKIGILGGTFDPVHSEHVRLAKSAIEELALDKLFVMPTCVPPHKKVMPASAEDRLNMLRLAFQGVDKVELSDYEIKKEGKSYTYLTVEHFKSVYENAQLYFIVGGDMLNDFHKWKYPERVLGACDLAVFGREDYFSDYQAQKEYFEKTFGKSFIKLNYNGKVFSSTKIRVYASFGLGIDGFTEPAVCEYIKETGLYKGDKYTEFVKKVLPEKRLIHTANVVVTAGKKVRSLGLDADQVRISATLHDCAKYMDYTKVKGFELPENVPQPVIHAFLGAFVAEKVLGITDAEILDAIRYHTSGKPEMSLLGKLIFVADMVEDTRNYEGVDKLRELYEREDFEKCFRECLKEEFLHLINKKQYIYSKTIDAVEYYEKH